MNQKFILIAAAFLLSACSNLAVTTPTPIIETPELRGADSFSFGGSLNLQSGHKYEATTDASRRPPILTAPEASHVLSTIGGLHAEFAKRIRIGVSADPLNGGAFGKAQVQLFGRGRKDAKAGDFSGSIFGHAGENSPDEDGDQSSTFGPGGNPWSAEIKSGWYDFGASFGYRLTDSANLFIGAAKQMVWYEVKIDQTQGAAPTGTYRASDRGEANKGMIGLAFGNERSELFIAADYTDIRYHHTKDLYVASATLGLNFDFN